MADKDLFIEKIVDSDGDYIMHLTDGSQLKMAYVEVKNPNRVKVKLNAEYGLISTPLPAENAIHTEGPFNNMLNFSGAKEIPGKPDHHFAYDKGFDKGYLKAKKEAELTVTRLDCEVTKLSKDNQTLSDQYNRGCVLHYDQGVRQAKLQCQHDLNKQHSQIKHLKEENRELKECLDRMQKLVMSLENNVVRLQKEKQEYKEFCNVQDSASEAMRTRVNELTGELKASKAEHTETALALQKEILRNEEFGELRHLINSSSTTVDDFINGIKALTDKNKGHPKRGV